MVFSCFFYPFSMHIFKQTFKYDIQMYIYTIWENIQITMMLSDNYSDNYHENGFIIEAHYYSF